MSAHETASAKRNISGPKRFEALLRPQFDALYRAARRLTQTDADAEDLVQEVSIKAFRRIEEFEEIEHKRAWLLRVLYHAFIDGERSRQRSPVALAETGDSSTEPDEMAGAVRRPDELADNEIRIAQVLRAMQCLSGEQCTLVAMRDVEGLSIEELVQLTGLPAGTVKSRLHRTRAKLGRLLANEAFTKPRLKAIGR